MLTNNSARRCSSERKKSEQREILTVHSLRNDISVVITVRHVYAEVAAGFAVFELVPYLAEEIAAEKQYNICKGDYNGYFIGQVYCDELKDKQRYINISKIFRLNGDEEKQQELCVGEDCRKRQKQRQIKVMTGGVAGDKSADDRADNTRKIEHVEVESAPRRFKLRAYHPVKICTDKHKNGVEIIGHKDKTEYAPDLPAENKGAVKFQH